MNAALRLLAQRRAVGRSICGQIDRLHALDHNLLLAIRGEPAERQDAVLTALGASDNAIMARLEGMHTESGVRV